MADKKFIGKCFEGRFDVAKLVLTAKEIITLNDEVKNGKVTILIKKSKQGSLYAEIDTWQPPANYA